MTLMRSRRRGTESVRLACDGDGCPAALVHHCTPEKPGPRHERALRNDASGRCWARFRRRPNGPLGDYCPACARRLLAEKGAVV
jgi:hypothetical protein